VAVDLWLSLRHCLLSSGLDWLFGIFLTHTWGVGILIDCGLFDISEVEMNLLISTLLGIGILEWIELHLGFG